MKTLAIVMVLSLGLVACSPSTQMIHHGNEIIQVTQTYNLFGTNVVERTKCKNGELVNGFCPADPQPSSLSGLTEGPGKEIAKSVLLGGAIVGGAAILANANAARMTQSVSQNGIGTANISTFVNK